MSEAMNMKATQICDDDLEQVTGGTRNFFDVALEKMQNDVKDAEKKDLQAKGIEVLEVTDVNTIYKA